SAASERVKSTLAHPLPSPAFLLQYCRAPRQSVLSAPTAGEASQTRDPLGQVAGTHSCFRFGRALVRNLAAPDPTVVYVAAADLVVTASTYYSCLKICDFQSSLASLLTLYFPTHQSTRRHQKPFAEKRFPVPSDCTF